MIKNPFLEYPNWSIKDCACIYLDGTFHLFFSAFYERDGQIRSHVVEVTTNDFTTFSEPILNFHGMNDGWIGMCSPDVVKVNNHYILTFNSWGDKPGEPNQLFYKSSFDLKNWGDTKPLASNLTQGHRAIDAAITYADNQYYLLWKDHQHRTQMASSVSLDADFNLMGEPTFDAEDGLSADLIHENYQFIIWNDTQYLLTTRYKPHEPVLYTRGDDWLTWVNGYVLDIPREEFNTDHGANASAIMLHNDAAYLIYAGNTENERFAGRGWNRLGIARSTDLIHWQINVDL